MKKLISVVTPCFNEEDNIHNLHLRVKAVMGTIPQYAYEHIFIDNRSDDNTVGLIKSIAEQDKRVKLIINNRNFGHIRSPMHGILQAGGDAVICMAADLQEPPEMIPKFLEQWEAGYPVVAAVKPASKETFLMAAIRRTYYRCLSGISEVKLIRNFTGFGLFDRRVVDTIRGLNDPYPYFRGLICELGYPVAEIPFVQPRRLRGITKNNFYTLYDIAMLGVTTHTRLPIRLATMFGFVLSGLSFLLSVLYLVLKLFFWDSFALGSAPLLIGMFFFSSVQLFFIGLIGEYVVAIHRQVLKRPLVVEAERVNFDQA